MRRSRKPLCVLLAYREFESPPLRFSPITSRSTPRCHLTACGLHLAAISADHAAAQRGRSLARIAVVRIVGLVAPVVITFGVSTSPPAKFWPFAAGVGDGSSAHGAQAA